MSTITFEIWDTAGQEKYRALAHHFFQGAAAVLMVFDVTDLDSVSELDYYRQLLEESFDVPHVVIGIIGNKIDLDDKRQFSQDDMSELEEKLSGDFAIFCSAKTGEGVDDIFVKLASCIELEESQTEPARLDPAASHDTRWCYC
jgi:small GTP-binding protein